MKTSVIFSIIIGLLVGFMAVPMLMIPLMGIGVVVAAFYLLFHDVIWPSIHHPQHHHEHIH